MRVLRPDDLLPQGEGRWTRETVAEAFATCARALRDEVLPDPAIARVLVLIGIPGAGKTTWAAAQPDDPAAVLYDVVNADPARRAALARKIRAAGKAAIAVHVVTPVAVALERNAARPSWRRVPEQFVRRVASQLLARPPSPAEGWSAVVVVRGDVAPV